MKRLLTFLLVLGAYTADAQSFDHISYKQEVNQAYITAVNKANYTESLRILEAVKKKYGMLYGEDYRLQSYCHKMLGNDSLAALSLKTCWSVPSFDMRTLWYVAALDPGKLMEGFNEYENQLVNEGFEIGAAIRPKNADSLLQVFRVLKEEDRIIWDEWETDRENKELQARIDIMNKEHEAFFESYVRTYGYPGEKQLQFMDSEIWVILVHSSGSEDFYQRMKPVFLEEVRKGNMSPVYYANFVDQHQMYNKLPSVYQSLSYVNKVYVNTKEEREQISKNRSEIGLVDLDFSLSK